MLTLTKESGRYARSARTFSSVIYFFTDVPGFTRYSGGLADVPGFTSGVPITIALYSNKNEAGPGPFHSASCAGGPLLP